MIFTLTILAVWLVPYIIVLVITTIATIWSYDSPVYIEDVRCEIKQLDEFGVRLIPILNIYLALICVIEMCAGVIHIFAYIADKLNKFADLFNDIRIK